MSEWRQTTVGDFCPFIYGKALPERARVTGDVPVISSAGVTGSHNRPLVEGAGIVVGRKGTVGSITLSPQPFWPIDTTFFIPDHAPTRDLYFTYYLLQTLGLAEMNTDSAVPGLNRDNAHARPIRVPGLGEQEAVASVLRALDDKIDLNRRMNETLEHMTRALFKDWFVDFGPTKAKMEGREPYLGAELWALFPERLDDEGKPEGWTQGLLGDLFNISIGRTPPRKEKQHFVRGGQGRTWLSIKTMGGLQTFAFDSEEDLTPEAVSRFRIPLIPAGTVIVSFKLTVGRVAIATNNMHSNEAIAHLVPHHSTPVSREYTYLFMKSFDYTVLGSTSSIATAVNSQSIKAIKMLVAEPGVQHYVYEARRSAI